MKREVRFLITISFAFFYLLIGVIVPTNYSALGPGFVTKVSDNIQIEDIENSNNFYSVAVYGLDKLTGLTRIVLDACYKWDVYETTIYESSITSKEDRLRGQISKRASYLNSLINAYRLANEKDSNIYLEVDFKGIDIYYRPPHLTNLKIGDRVIKINDELLTKENYQEIIKANKFENVELTIIRDNETKNIDVTYQVGDYVMSYYPYYEIVSSYPEVSLPGLSSDTGGPSGGLMQTISLYVSLLNINFGNLKIAGTGTINEAGIVGEIGGITQKLYTVDSNKMDYFIIPKSQYKEISSLKHKTEIILVTSIDDAVHFLEKIKIN